MYRNQSSINNIKLEKHCTANLNVISNGNLWRTEICNCEMYEAFRTSIDLSSFTGLEHGNMNVLHVKSVLNCPSWYNYVVTKIRLLRNLFHAYAICKIGYWEVFNKFAEKLDWRRISSAIMMKFWTQVMFGISNTPVTEFIFLLFIWNENMWLAEQRQNKQCSTDIRMAVHKVVSARNKRNETKQRTIMRPNRKNAHANYRSIWN